MVAAPALSAAALPPSAAASGHAGQVTATASWARVVSLWGGARSSIALKADGTVWTWGWNGFGQLGDGTASDRSSPVQVIGLDTVIYIAARDYHTMVIKSDGFVWAWGSGGKGELGNTTTADRNTPGLVLFETAPFTPTAWLYLPWVSR